MERVLVVGPEAAHILTGAEFLTVHLGLRHDDPTALERAAGNRRRGVQRRGWFVVCCGSVGVVSVEFGGS